MIKTKKIAMVGVHLNTKYIFIEKRIFVLNIN